MLTTVQRCNHTRTLVLTIAALEPIVYDCLSATKRLPTILD